MRKEKKRTVSEPFLSHFSLVTKSGAGAKSSWLIHASEPHTRTRQRRQQTRGRQPARLQEPSGRRRGLTAQQPGSEAAMRVLWATHNQSVLPVTQQ